jgi:transcriptional regulator with XRE-family HTH domain
MNRDAFRENNVDDERPQQLGRDLGPRLNAARREAGVGLRALARQIGVSPGLISQVENGKIAPSVSTLYAIATTLGLSFDYLFRGADPLSERSAVGAARVQHEAERPTVRLASGVRWERLTFAMRDDFEFLHVVYEPGSASCEAGALLQHGGEEYAFLLTGRLGLTIGAEDHLLTPGDSISFDAHTPHRIWNAGEGPASAIWVVLQRRFDERAS